jgi:pyruvate formate lyase activating enzyme
MKEALFYEKISAKGGSASGGKEKTVRCQACNHYCQIAPGKRGICGVRENQAGKLYSLVYGKVVAKNIDPIEKKPLFHFLPGTRSLSIATVGCNFRCSYCQNADIAQMPKENALFTAEKVPGVDLLPQDIVETALNAKLSSISYTYTEPTVFIEFALDTMKLARKKKIKNVWVTNGYTSKEVLKEVIPYLDAANVDLKGFTEEFYNKVCGAKLKPVLETLKAMKRGGVWVEVTTLVVPGQNDTKEQFEGIANFIAKELGKDVPWHISKFFPTYKLADLPPTPPSSLLQAYEFGKKAGLKYTYLGNLPLPEYETTFCPKCKTKMIERAGYEIIRHDKDGKCAKCGQNLSLVLK